MLSKGLDAVTTDEQRVRLLGRRLSASPSFPSHRGFCNCTNKLTRFLLFWGLVCDLSNKLVLVQVSIAATTELCQPSHWPQVHASHPAQGCGVGGVWFGYFTFYSTRGAKCSPGRPPQGEELGFAGARCSTPGTTRCDWDSSCWRGWRVKIVSWKISDPKAWCLLLHPTNKTDTCVCVWDCVGMGGWMCATTKTSAEGRRGRTLVEQWI